MSAFVRVRGISEGRKIVKKLKTITSLATTGAFLLLMVSGLAACGQSAQKGVASAPQQSASSGGDELQRAKSHIATTSESDELQRAEARDSATPESDELQRAKARIGVGS